jgi:hypothetical protein
MEFASRERPPGYFVPACSKICAAALTSAASRIDGGSRSCGFTLRLRIALFFDRLAHARYGFYAIPGVKAGGVEQMSVPRAPWQPGFVDQLPLALNQLGVDLTQQPRSPS